VCVAARGGSRLADSMTLFVAIHTLIAGMSSKSSVICVHSCDQPKNMVWLRLVGSLKS